MRTNIFKQILKLKTWLVIVLVSACANLSTLYADPLPTSLVCGFVSGKLVGAINKAKWNMAGREALIFDLINPPRQKDYLIVEKKGVGELGEAYIFHFITNPGADEIYNATVLSKVQGRFAVLDSASLLRFNLKELQHLKALIIFEPQPNSSNYPVFLVTASSEVISGEFSILGGDTMLILDESAIKVSGINEPFSPVTQRPKSFQSYRRKDDPGVYAFPNGGSITVPNRSPGQSAKLGQILMDGKVEKLIKSLERSGGE